MGVAAAGTGFSAVVTAGAGAVAGAVLVTTVDVIELSGGAGLLPMK